MAMHYVHRLGSGVSEDLFPRFASSWCSEMETGIIFNSVLKKDDETQTGNIRIWDLRALDSSDIKTKQTLSSLRDRSKLSQAGEVHPKLDWANIYLDCADIAYCIEWHDRLWPRNEKVVTGFTNE